MLPQDQRFPGQGRPRSGSAPLPSQRGNDLRRRARTMSFEEGEQLMSGSLALDPTENRPPEPRESSPRIEMLTAPQPVEIDMQELALWAEECGYELIEGRVFDPDSPRTDMVRPGQRVETLQCELIIDCRRVTDLGISVCFSSLPYNKFCRYAQTIDVSKYPKTHAMFCTFGGRAKDVVGTRSKQNHARSSRLRGLQIDACRQGREGLIGEFGGPMSHPQVQPGQLRRCLPVPEGTTGIFSCGRDEVLDLCSSGFSTCMGVVLVARHPNGRRTVGMTHLNQECVEEIASCFNGFVTDVLGPDGGNLEVYLVGGGGGGRGSLMLARSLIEFFKALGDSRDDMECELRGQSLFDGARAYMFRSTDDELSLHRPTTREEGVLSQREQLLRDHHELYDLSIVMLRQFGLSGSELMNLCNRDRPHPLRHLLDDDDQSNDEGDQLD